METEPMRELPIYRSEIIEAAKHAVRPGYLPVEEMEYHNELHYPETLEEADRLIKFCEANGMTLDRETIELALIGHDYYYFLLDTEHPGQSKEEYSAEKYAEILRFLGVDEQKVEKVQKCILFTQAGVHFADFADANGELNDDLRTCLIITRRSDIKNLRDSTLVFLSNSVKLYYESIRQHNKAGTTPLKWPAFLLKQQEFLNMLLEDDLSLGDFDQDENKQCLFTKIAKERTALLSNENIANFTKFFTKHRQELRRYLPWFKDESDLEQYAA